MAVTSTVTSPLIPLAVPLVVTASAGMSSPASASCAVGSVVSTGSAVASPEDVQRADVALSKPSEFSNFPDNASDAFARSAAATNALSDASSFPVAQSSQALPNAPSAAPHEAEPAPDNSSFQVAQAFQNRPGASENLDALETVREATLNESETLADAAPQTTASETDSASSTRSQLALNDSTLSNSVADPLADSMSANSLPTPDADAALVAGGAYPDPLADPLPAPQNSLLDEDAPANDPLLASASKNPPAPQVQTSSEQVAQPQTPAPQIVAQTAPNAQGSSYAADPLPTPNSELSAGRPSTIVKRSRRSIKRKSSSKPRSTRSDDAVWKAPRSSVSSTGPTTPTARAKRRSFASRVAPF